MIKKLALTILFALSLTNVTSAADERTAAAIEALKQGKTHLMFLAGGTDVLAVTCLISGCEMKLRLF